MPSHVHIRGRDWAQLRVAILSGTGDAFTAGADLKTHAPEWQKVGSMVGRERLEDGLSGITRGPLSRITKPIVAAINGWCLGHGIELSMACDIRVASERAQFGTFEVRRGMHSADGGIVRLLNMVGVGVAMEMILTGEPFSAERALMTNMVNKVVPHDDLMPATEDLVARILRCGSWSQCHRRWCRFRLALPDYREPPDVYRHRGRRLRRARYAWLLRSTVDG